MDIVFSRIQAIGKCKEAHEMRHGGPFGKEQKPFPGQHAIHLLSHELSKAPFCVYAANFPTLDRRKSR